MNDFYDGGEYQEEKPLTAAELAKVRAEMVRMEAVYAAHAPDLMEKYGVSRCDAETYLDGLLTTEDLIARGKK